MAVYRQCTFESNTAPGGGGGGAAVQDASPRFTSCTWRGNTRDHLWGRVLCRSGRRSPRPPATLALSACQFLGNTVTGTGYGGGAIYVQRDVADTPANLAFLRAPATPRHRDMLPRDLSCAAEPGPGWCCQQPLQVANPPAFINNTYRRYAYSTLLLFENGVTFDGNSAADPTASGGALYVEGGGNVTLSGNNVTFRNNRAGLFGGGVYLSSGTAALQLLGSSSWSNNTAVGSARGDHLYSASGGSVALGGAALHLDGDPTRVREGIVIGPQAGEVTWGGAEGAVPRARRAIR